MTVYVVCCVSHCDVSPVQMLREQDLDILAVQEVRFESADHAHNQIGELAAFLQGYQVCHSRHLSCHILWSKYSPHSNRCGRQ